MDALCLPVLSLIHSSVRMGHFTTGRKEFRKAPHFFPLLSAPIEAIIGGTNNEMTNSMTSHIRLYKENEEEQVKGEWWKKRILQEAGKVLKTFQNVGVIFEVDLVEKRFLSILFLMCQVFEWAISFQDRKNSEMQRVFPKFILSRNQTAHSKTWSL